MLRTLLQSLFHVYLLLRCYWLQISKTFYIRKKLYTVQKLRFQFSLYYLRLFFIFYVSSFRPTEEFTEPFMDMLKYIITLNFQCQNVLSYIFDAFATRSTSGRR